MITRNYPIQIDSKARVEHQSPSQRGEVHDTPMTEEELINTSQGNNWL